MGDQLRVLAQEARQLPREERIKLLEAIIDSLDDQAPDIDRAWAREIDDRWQAYLRGEMPTRPASDVLAKYLQP